MPIAVGSINCEEFQLFNKTNANGFPVNQINSINLNSPDDNTIKMGDFKIETKFVKYKDAKQEEADSELKKRIITFSKIHNSYSVETGSMIQYASKEQVAKFLSAIEKQLQSGATINQEIHSIHSGEQDYLSYYVTDGLRAMEKFEDQDKLIRMLVDNKWNLNTIHVDKTKECLSDEFDEAKCENQGLERAMIFDIMDCIGFMSQI